MVTGMFPTAAAVSPAAGGPDMAVMGFSPEPAPAVSLASAEGQQRGIFDYKLVWWANWTLRSVLIRV